MRARGFERSVLSRDRRESSKVLSLRVAVARFVRPGACLYLGGYPFPHAACNEVFRLFVGRKSGLTAVVTSANSCNLAPWVHAGLLKRLVSSFNGDGMPYPSPNPVFTRARAEGSVEFEDWTMLTTVLRLWAGAFRVPFVPIGSIAGSSLEGNRSGFKRVANPFGRGSVGVAGACEPDLAFVQGVVADPMGRVVLPIPYGVGIYGALASRGGVIATVEKILPASAVDAYRHHVVLPPEIVLAVCEVPFGAHPTALVSPGVAEEPGYGEDPDFVLEARRACRDPQSHEAWIRRWITECADSRTYVRRLGNRRLRALRRRTDPSTWREERPSGLKHLSHPAGPSPAERMIVTAAREISRTAKANGHRAILAGVGAAHLAAFLAYRTKRNPGYRLMVEIGAYGFYPVEGEAFIFHARNFNTALLNTDIATILGMCLPHPRIRSLGALGAAQVDRQGNLNSTLIPGTPPFILGSGGANDVASLADRVIVVAEQTRERLVRRLPYVTCPGKRVAKLVTQLGVFEKRGRDLVLAALIGKATVAEVQAACGWRLRREKHLRRIPPPTRAELALLRDFDPGRYFLGRV
ncbi:MAG: hypothetical protein HYY13_07265 [Nitrospirae bacterium]|nr:hypothetical protein [Nitrospirota bacterium]